MKTKEKKINRVEEWLSVAVLIAILILLSYQVIMRFVFHNTNSWSEELARYLFIWLVYLSASYAIYKNAHIKIDAVKNLYPKKIRKYIPILGNLIFLVYAVVITVYSCGYCMDIYASHQVSMGLGVMMAYMYASIPVGHALMSLRLIQLTYKMIKNPDLEETTEAEEVMEMLEESNEGGAD